MNNKINISHREIFLEQINKTDFLKFKNNYYATFI